MPKFRKKPVVIEAEQFFQDKEPLPFQKRLAVCFDGQAFYVETIHRQKVYLADGDWIIPEPDGEHFYPVKPDIFAATYEPVFALESVRPTYRRVTCAACGYVNYYPDGGPFPQQCPECHRLYGDEENAGKEAGGR